MPIEEVVLTPTDNIHVNLASKILQREFWCRELGSAYSYGLNDNVKDLGNITRNLGQGMVVYTLFNRQPHKYHNRQTRKRLNKLEHDDI